MKALLKANSKNQMKDELQRKEVEREGNPFISVVYAMLLMCQALA